jgi:uncharacterized repeat protein (TIGR01451 family)
LGVSAFWIHAAAFGASAGSGSGFGLATDLTALPLLGAATHLQLGPAPANVSGSAPPDFDQSGTVVGISGSLLGGGVSVSSGTLNAGTQSTLLANDVRSDASVENLNLALTVLGLTAQTVTSSAAATCSAGSVALSGSSHLVGVGLSGLLLGATVDAFPAPNTVLLNVLGVRVTLNEQVTAGNQLTVNAIHVALDNAVLTGLGVLSGDIYVARSVAAMADCALPDLASSKSGPTSAVVGSAYDYVLSLTNVGGIATSGTITVTDTISNSVVINTLQPGPNFTCNAIAQTVSCTSNAPIGAGASVTVVTVNVTPLQSGLIINTAVASGGGDDTPVNNVSPPVSTDVGPAPIPDLAMGKSGPTSATVGVPFGYSLTLANVGTGATSGLITVTDTVPAGLSINSVVPGAQFGCNINAQTVTCTSSNPLSAGSSGVLVATINVTPTQAGGVSNVATVSGGGDNSPSNNTSPPVNTTVNAAPTPDLAIGKSGPATATVGVSFAYTLTLSNVGAAATSGTVTVTDVIPASLSVGSIVAGGGFGCGVAAQTVTCTSTAPISPATSGLVVATINVTPISAGSISNVGSVSGGGDNSPSNNVSPPVDTSVSATPTPDLAIAKTGPSTAMVGSAFSYSIAVSNIGNGATTGTVTVTDNVAASLVINSVLSGTGFACGANGQLVTCTATGAIAAGTSGITVATINVTATAAGPVANTAMVSGGGDGNPDNNTSPPVTTSVSAVALPDLTVAKSGPATAFVGVPFDYALSISNVGAGATSSVVTVTDVVPSSLAIDHVTAGPTFTCVVTLQTVACTSSDSIGAGAANIPVVTITVTPTQEALLSNTATVGVGNDPNPSNDVSPPIQTSVSPQGRPDLTIAKSGPPRAPIGLVWSYLLRMSNIGAAPTSGLITVSDVVPSALTVYDVVAQPPFSCSLSNHLVTCTTVEVFQPGSGEQGIVEIFVSASALGSVENTAFITGGGDDSPGNNASPPVPTQFFDSSDVRLFAAGAAPVPVLSPWALLGLGLGLAAIGASMRKRGYAGEKGSP